MNFETKLSIFGQEIRDNEIKYKPLQYIHFNTGHCASCWTSHLCNQTFRNQWSKGLIKQLFKGKGLLMPKYLKNQILRREMAEHDYGSESRIH